MLLERIARVRRAQAAIVTAAKMCEPGLEEQVAYAHALDEARHSRTSSASSRRT